MPKNKLTKEQEARFDENMVGLIEFVPYGVDDASAVLDIPRIKQ